jgi:hypothetical protein
MEQNIFSKVKICSASQEILSVSWESKVYYSLQQPVTNRYIITQVGPEYFQ